jgi:ribonuclease-3
MDSDVEATTTVVMHLCHEEIASLDLNHEHLNPKGRLQEILQASGAPSPRYEMLDQRGPDHRKEFVSRVFWLNEPLGVGQGTSKKHAEADAARHALNHPMVVALLVKNPALDPNSPTPPLLPAP